MAMPCVGSGAFANSVYDTFLYVVLYVMASVLCLMRWLGGKSGGTMALLLTCSAFWCFHGMGWRKVACKEPHICF